MKIGILILTIILTFTSLNAFRFKWPYAILGNNPTKPRFMQSKINLKEKYELKAHGEKALKAVYKMKISIIKETDSLEDVPISFDTSCDLTKDSIKLYEFGKLRNEISYLDFFFFDGVVLFNDLTFFMKIHSVDYLDIMNNLRPKIEFFAKRMGTKEFNKYCFFAFRRKPRDNDKPQLGLIYTSVIFCLDQNSPNEILSKFFTDFIRNYETAITNESDLNKVQQYRLKQNIMIQYYDPSERISLENPRLPNFYTSFAKEGLVLNASKDYDPKHVRYSFRFDQIVQCKADEASTLKQVLNPKIATLFRDDECCVSYMVDWNQKGVKNMFCSMYNTKWKCRVDIKIFESTLYAYCLEQHMERINKNKKIYKNDLEKAKMYFLERAATISALKNIQDFNLETIWDKFNYFYKIIEEEKKVVKEDLFASLKAFDKEIGDPSKGLINGCNNIIDVHKTEKQKAKAALADKPIILPETPRKDFEQTNNQQNKQEFSPAIISLKNLEDLKYRFCKELKQMLKNDKQVEIDYNNKKKKEEEDEIDQASNSKKNKILAVLTNIKSIMVDFTIIEINRVIEIVLRNPDIIDELIKKKVIFTKEIILEILHNSVEDAIRKLRAFVSEKTFKIDYESDPTHKNTTTVCLPKGSNNTKEDNFDKPDNKTDDKPGQDDDSKKDDFPNLFDDPSGYFDESDYYKITGTPFGDRKKNKVKGSPKVISVPRSIPKLEKQKEVNPPIVPPPYHYDPPKPNPNSNHDDEEPQPFFGNPNSGVVIEADQNAIKDDLNKQNTNDNNNNNQDKNNTKYNNHQIEADSNGINKFIKNNKNNPFLNNKLDPSNPHKPNDTNKPNSRNKPNNKNNLDVQNNDKANKDMKNDKDHKITNNDKDPNEHHANPENKGNINNNNNNSDSKNNDLNGNKETNKIDDGKKNDKKDNHSDNKSNPNSKSGHLDKKPNNNPSGKDHSNDKNPSDNKAKDTNFPNEKSHNSDKDSSLNEKNKSKNPEQKDPNNKDPTNKNSKGDNKNPNSTKEINSINKNDEKPTEEPVNPSNPNENSKDEKDKNEKDNNDPNKHHDKSNSNDANKPNQNDINGKDNSNHIDLNDNKGNKDNKQKENEKDGKNINNNNPNNSNKENPNHQNSDINNHGKEFNPKSNDRSVDNKNSPNSKKDEKLNPNNNHKDTDKDGQNSISNLGKNLEVFSATVTRHFGDPLKPPKEVGRIYKNPVDPKSAEKLLKTVNDMNAELQQGKVKKRLLKKLY